MGINKKHPRYQEDLRYVIGAGRAEFLAGKSILITGATGLLGVHLIDALMLAGNVRIYAVGRSRTKAAERLGEYFDNPMFSFIEQDVTALFDRALKVDYILPLASNTHPLAYSKFPVETIMTNVKGAENALELAVATGAEVIYPSSVEIYGNAYGDEDFSEEDTGKLNLSTARSCYTESKRVCEAMCQSYAAEKGVVVKIARLSRVFGPTMLESDTKASSQFIKNALAGEDIVLKSKGEQYFSYIYSSDAVAAILHMMQYGRSSEVYNISNPECDIKLKDFAAICAECGGTKVVFDLPDEEESRGYSVATRAILSNKKLAGVQYATKYSIREAIRRTISILADSSHPENSTL